jgi:hypothetical protein
MLEARPRDRVKAMTPSDRRRYYWQYVSCVSLSHLTPRDTQRRVESLGVKCRNLLKLNILRFHLQQGRAQEAAEHEGETVSSNEPRQ